MCTYNTNFHPLFQLILLAMFGAADNILLNMFDGNSICHFQQRDTNLNHNRNYNPNSKLIHELWSKTFGQGKLKKKRLQQSKEAKTIGKAGQG